MYIWQRSYWPAFRWDCSRLIQPLSAAARRYGSLVRGLRHLSPGCRLLVQSDALTEDTVQSSGIEGEMLSRDPKDP